MAEYHWEKRRRYHGGGPARREERSLPFGNFEAWRRTGRISAFVEKPKDPEVQTEFVSRPHDEERPLLGSMGIYLFKTKVLIDLLTYHFPDMTILAARSSRRRSNLMSVYGFDFDGYWEDIGTIRSFYETNLKLTSSEPAVQFL